MGGGGGGAQIHFFSARNAALARFDPIQKQKAEIDVFHDLLLRKRDPISPGSIMGRNPLLLHRCHFEFVLDVPETSVAII